MPGSQVAVSAGRGSVLVVRDGARLRGFANVCRHRGHELLTVGAHACRTTIRCPYHAWTYELDGTLRAATGFERPGRSNPDEAPLAVPTDRGGFVDADADPDPVEHALGSVRVDEHLGWVFANADSSAVPLPEAFAGLDAILAAYRIGDLAPVETRTYDVAANWKVIHENYQECLHCPRIHPELCRVSPPESSHNLAPGPAWVGGWMDLAAHAATMSMTGEAVAAPLPGLDEERRRQVAYIAMLPSLLVSAHPDYVMTHRIEPLAVDRTRVTCQWLAVAPSPASSGAIDGAVELWDITNREDWAACESVQRGLASGAYVPGPLAPREDAVHSVVRWFARAYVGPGDEQSP